MNEIFFPYYLYNGHCSLPEQAERNDLTKFVKRTESE